MLEYLFYNQATKINVANTIVGTNALGPGFRSVVWVQGCPFRCEGCFSPAWVPMNTASLWDPAELAARLTGDSRVSGLTISGGEPMIQARVLATLVEHVKRIAPSWDVIVFTGFKWEQLQKFPVSHPIHQFIKGIDVLIDGPYDQNQNEGIGLRGSSNQRVIHFTDRLVGNDFENQPRVNEVHVKKGEIVFVGVPQLPIPGVVRTLEASHVRA